MALATAPAAGSLPDFLPTPPHIAELDRLGDEIARLAAHLDAASARLLDLIREFDRRGGWNTGFRSCAAWLTWRVGLAPGAAREKVRVGPVYAILRLDQALDQLRLADGGPMARHVARQPFLTHRVSTKWDGEWQVTWEVFRDLGLAFGAVMVLIDVLVVGWFRSFRTPLVIMAPIPLTLVGILPAHALLGAFFTATSMIGFIAGAGIIVRNSIILVDFLELRRAQGLPLAEAVVEAGAVRFRPMLLTAAAVVVVVGASVMLFDPIFQDLALSLMAGEVASTLLSRVAVPVLYYMSER
jgi:hypothetical protein